MSPTRLVLILAFAVCQSADWTTSSAVEPPFESCSEPDCWPGVEPVSVKYADTLDRIRKMKRTHPNNLAIKHFDFDYFGTLTVSEQTEFLDIIHSGIWNENSQMGCYAKQVPFNPTIFSFIML